MTTARATGAGMQNEIHALRALLQSQELPGGVTPAPGRWTDEAYLAFTDGENWLLELTDGVIEILPMPTWQHQQISAWLFDAFRAHVRPTGGAVAFSPLRLQVRPGKFREPDILVLRDAADPRAENRFWHGADLVVEVVSPGGMRRDLVEKRLDYAEAGVPEYWIVDPFAQRIIVLGLNEGAYTEVGVFGRGAVATSRLLSGFEVQGEELFDAARVR